MTPAESIAKLQTMTTAELSSEFERLHGRKPRCRSVPWLKKRIAHALQIAAYGGLSRTARTALDRLAGDIALPAAPRAELERPRGELRPGTTLLREWHGQQIRVAITADGIEWDGRVFASLSAAAFAITGTKWNGRLFFGLVDRKHA